MIDPILDEELSALLDGELTGERAAELEERLAEEPALSARFAALARVDESLKAIAAEDPLRSPSPALGEALQALIAAERSGGSSVASPSVDRAVHRPALRSATPRRAKRRNERIWIGVAAAAAASLLLYLSTPFLTPLLTPRGPILEFDGGASQLAGEKVIESRATVDESALPDLAEASDEEIGIALDYETLADLDVIEDLKLLELMIELEEAGRPGRAERG